MRGFEGDVFYGVGDGVLDDGFVAAVVGDVVVEELGWGGIQFLVVVGGDIGGDLLEDFAGLGVEIGAGDFEALPEVLRGDLGGEFIGGLVVILGNLAVALLVFDEVIGCADGHPDVDDELQRNIRLAYGDGGMGGIGLVGQAPDGGVGNKIGIADGDLAGAQLRHVGRRGGGVKGAGSEGDRQLADSGNEDFAGPRRGIGVSRYEPSRNDYAQKHNKHK